MGRRAHASHILLRQKSDADRLLSEIQEARKPLKTFQKLAKKHSKCPSGQRGGDLGWFDERQKGDILAILNDDINQLERFLDKGANDLLQVSTTVVVVGAVLLIISWEVALFAVW